MITETESTINKKTNFSKTLMESPNTIQSADGVLIEFKQEELWDIENSETKYRKGTDLSVIENIEQIPKILQVDSEIQVSLKCLLTYFYVLSIRLFEDFSFG